MYYFKGRYQEQKKANIDSFHEKLNKNLIELNELQKFKFYQNKLSEEIGKGLLVGGAFSLLAYINFRNIKVTEFSKNKRIFSVLLPILISPLYFYAACMEEFHRFENLMGLKYGRNDKTSAITSS